MNPRMKRALALLIFALTVLHPAVHGETLCESSGPSLSDKITSVDCPCVRAALIPSDAPEQPARMVESWDVDAVVESHVSAATPLAVASRAPPAA